jgi:hypothetical protein
MRALYGNNYEPLLLFKRKDRIISTGGLMKLDKLSVYRGVN